MKREKLKTKKTGCQTPKLQSFAPMPPIKPAKSENDNFLFFSDRQKLAELYEDWRRANNVNDCPLSLITFLHTEKMLDVETVRKEIERYTKNENHA